MLEVIFVRSHCPRQSHFVYYNTVSQNVSNNANDSSVKTWSTCDGWFFFGALSFCWCCSYSAIHSIVRNEVIWCRKIREKAKRCLDISNVLDHFSLHFIHYSFGLTWYTHASFAAAHSFFAYAKKRAPTRLIVCCSFKFIIQVVWTRCAFVLKILQSKTLGQKPI